MSRFEGPGYEARAAQLKREFKRSSVGYRRREISRLLRKIGSGAGLIVLGAGVGASAFIVFESFQPADREPRESAFGLRGPYYSSCRDAFQDGRANILRGEPGYRVGLDADGDGKACEPYTGPRS